MHSILLKVGPFTIYSYGFMLMLAFLAGTLVATRLARRSGIPSETILDLTAYILLAAIVGSRLFYVALQWGYFRDHLAEIPKIWTGGLTFHGGLLGGILVGAWFCWRRRQPFLLLADILTPSVALGYALGRIGCFLNGCCYGAPTSLPWACQFHDPPVSGPLTPPSHPTQIYASLINLGIFAILWQIARRKRSDGQVFFSYLVLYSIYRFGIEFLRKGYTADVLGAGLTQAQVVSLLIAALGIALLVWVRRTPAPSRGEGVHRRAAERAEKGYSLEEMPSSASRAGAPARLEGDGPPPSGRGRAVKPSHERPYR
jgi:phosphatidylglycerol:prolipoprotein diacylglycerol transferase